MTWFPIVNHADYEICDEYPHNIRRVGSTRTLTVSNSGSGYPRVKLNLVDHSMHRLVATQFIPNPDNLPQVDHINHDISDYHISNLRWVSRSSNQRNRRSYRGVEYEWLEDDEVPDDRVEVNDYNAHEFEDYYYSPSLDRFMFYNGIRYRLLHINYSRSGSAFVSMVSNEGKGVSVYYSKFKRLYGYQ